MERVRGVLAQTLIAVKRRTTAAADRIVAGLLRRVTPLPTIRLDAIVRGPVDIVAPAIVDGICLPPYLGPRDHDDFSALMRIAAARQPRVIFEFGTAFGNTVANLCLHVPQALVYTLNAPASAQSGDTVTYALAPGEIGRVYRANGFGHRVVQILENSLTVGLARYLSGRLVELGIIDACHDVEYVMNDFLKLEPYVAPGGIVLLHDTDPSMEGHLRGSYRACVRLRRAGFDIRQVEGTWWAIWMRR